MSKQTEALRLADAMTFAFPGNKGIDMAAAELRRLHAENQALRQALAEAALDKKADNARELGLSYGQPAQQDSSWCMKMNGCKTKCEDCPDEVPEKPAPAQEPVAWQWLDTANFRTKIPKYAERDAWRPLYTTPPAPEQERVDAKCCEDDGCPTEKAVLQRFWRGQEIPEQHYPAWFRSTPPAPAQEPDPDELAIAHMSGLHEGKKIGAKEGRNKLATWMMQCGFATGHGDTLEELLYELGIEIEDRLAAERTRFALECIDLVAFYGGPVDLEAAIREKGGAE